MRIRSSKWYGALMASALAILGFESCSDKDEGGDYIVEYGTPNVSYRILGTVTDEQGQPIEGIKAVSGIVSESKMYPFDSIHTDKNGLFDLKGGGSPGRYDDFKVILTDIDGQANGGEFLPDTISLEGMDKKKTKDGSGWYEGEYTLTGSFKMKKKAEGDVPETPENNEQ